MAVSNRVVAIAAAVIVVAVGAEALLRLSDVRDLRQSVTELTAKSETAGDTATLASTTATQALARANEARTAADRASALAASAKETADQAAAAAGRATAVPAPVQQPASATSASAAQQGRGLALLICAACHVVAADQQFTPTLRPPAPDFHAIANRPTTTAKSLHDFLLVPHGKMPDAMLADYQTTALVSYIMSLKDQH